MGRLLLSILFALTLVPATSARGWRGIVPLHSTRVDVERLLGKPTPERDYRYNTDKEFVRVDYAKAPCDGFRPGWNVPTDTVLSLTVRSNTQQVFSELHLDTEGFSKVYDDASFTYYASRTLGIEYVVSREGFLNSVIYFPLAGDAGLRCKCFPLDDGSAFRGETWDSFEGVSRDSLLGRLDNYAIQLSNFPADWRGLVITYSPLRAGRTGADAFRKLVHDRLIVKRGLDPHRVTIIDGGHREHFAGELYFLSPGVSAPPPLPTVGSCDPKRVH